MTPDNTGINSVIVHSTCQNTFKKRLNGGQAGNAMKPKTQKRKNKEDSSFQNPGLGKKSYIDYYIIKKSVCQFAYFNISIFT